MIDVIVSILALFAAICATYLLTVIDSIVNNQLYQFGLNFNDAWAGPYWMAFRISLALLGLIVAAASMNITFFFWKKPKEPEIPRAVKRKGEKAKAEPPPIRAGVPSLFQCTSCRRSITHPLRMLDFHSQRPKMVNICPFCNATVVPIGYTHSKSEATPTEEDEEQIKKRINRSFQ